MDSRFTERLARGLGLLGAAALGLVLLGLAGHPRLMGAGVLLLVATPLIALAGTGLVLLRSAPRIGVTALVTVAIAILGALLGG